jgi:hypothetical protein
MDSDDYIPRSGRMPCYEPLCCNANRKPIPLFSLYNSLNFPDSIAINYCAPSQYWLQQQLDKRGMTIFDLDPQVQQHEARKAGREKEWLEAREAARRACN